jgi:hypothetical protein
MWVSGRRLTDTKMRNSGENFIILVGFMKNTG